jgi:hypothetical protein
MFTPAIRATFLLLFQPALRLAVPACSAGRPKQ